MVVDGNRMVADDEFYIGIFSRDNLAHPFSPDRAVHHADTLHLEHQLVLSERGILGLQPVQPLGRAYFLDVEVFEKGLEILLPFSAINACKRPNGLCSLGIDVAKQAAFNFVIDRCSKERRI